jgi:hypothetical protein
MHFFLAVQIPRETGQVLPALPYAPVTPCNPELTRAKAKQLRADG